MAQSRYYSSVAPETTLVNTINASDTTMQVQSTAGLPLNTPFPLTIDYNGSNAEIVDVTSVGGTTLTITRAVDGTTASTHVTGARVRHTSSARDFNEANAHINNTSNVHGVTGAVVGTTDTQTISNKTLLAAILNSPSITGTATIAGATFSGSYSGSQAFSGLTWSGTVNTSGLTFKSAAVGNTTLSLDAIASQSGNLLSLHDSSGNLIALFTSGGALNLQPTSIGQLPLMINSPSGTSQDLANFRVNGSTLAKVDNTGAVTATSYTATGVGQTFETYKTSTTSKTNTTTPTLDPHLVATVGTGVWKVQAMLRYAANSNGSSGGLSVGLGGTATTTTPNFAGVVGPDPTSATALKATDVGFGSVTSFYASASGTPTFTVIIDGVVNVTAGGTIGINWAQASAAPIGTNLFSGSRATFTRIA